MLKNFFFYFVVLPFLAISMTSCDSDDNVLNTKLVRGQWEMVNNDAEINVVYDFTTQSDLTWSWGTLTTTHFRVSDMTAITQEKYNFHISDPVNNKGNVTIDLTTDYEPTPENSYSTVAVYRIDKLTSREMLWSLISGTGEKTMKFRRKN